MKNFNHFLLTRFNVRLNRDDIGYGSDLGVSPEWLNGRFELFDKFCYPSVRGQSNQNFKWILFCNSLTPDIFKDKLKEYSKWENFIPIYVDKFSLERIRENLLPYITKGTEYLITTTLDNDDAISKDYIQLIQDNFQEQKFELLNFTYGYAWNTRNGNIYLKGTGNNHFMTLIEEIEGFKTIWIEPHNNYYKLYGKTGVLRQIRVKPTWLEVVHGGNLYNTVNGIRQPRKNMGDDFSINVENIMREENSLLIWVDQRFNYLKSMKKVRAIRTKIALRTRLRNALHLFKLS